MAYLDLLPLEEGFKMWEVDLTDFWLPCFLLMLPYCIITNHQNPSCVMWIPLGSEMWSPLSVHGGLKSATERQSRWRWGTHQVEPWNLSDSMGSFVSEVVELMSHVDSSQDSEIESYSMHCFFHEFMRSCELIRGKHWCFMVFPLEVLQCKSGDIAILPGTMLQRMLHGSMERHWRLGYMVISVRSHAFNRFGSFFFGYLKVTNLQNCHELLNWFDS